MSLTGAIYFGGIGLTYAVLLVWVARQYVNAEYWEEPAWFVSILAWAWPLVLAVGALYLACHPLRQIRKRRNPLLYTTKEDLRDAYLHESKAPPESFYYDMPAEEPY